MKVLMVMESWGDGGTETYVRGLIRLLISHKVEVVLVLLSDGQSAGIDFLPRDRVLVTGLRGLSHVLKRERPDVINLHLYSRLLPVTLAGRLLGFPLVTTLHMPLHSWGMRHRLYWRLAIRLSSKVVSVSKLVRDQANSSKMHPGSIPGGVDPQFFINKPDGNGLQAHGFRIIAIGRLSVEKGWPTLMGAIALLSTARRQQILIDFFGDGSLRADLEELAEKYGIRVVFHGWVDKYTLVNALASADLSVLPSLFEGLGLSALEGMAAGVPTITADFGAAHDFIEHGVTGHMFPIGDAAALAQLIEWHIDHPSESKSIGRTGRTFVREHFSEEVTYLPYLDIFKQLAH